MKDYTNCYLDAEELCQASATIGAYGVTMNHKGNMIIADGGETVTYKTCEYPTAYAVALRCIDRMIPRRVYEEYDPRLFQSVHNDGWREYQCPECKTALDDCVPEDEAISDVIFYCPFCGQALEWE